jgi:hypothetical protein
MKPSDVGPNNPAPVAFDPSHLALISVLARYHLLSEVKTQEK